MVVDSCFGYIEVISGFNNVQCLRREEPLGIYRSVKTDASLLKMLFTEGSDTNTYDSIPKGTHYHSWSPKLVAPHLKAIKLTVEPLPARPFIDWCFPTKNPGHSAVSLVKTKVIQQLTDDFRWLITAMAALPVRPCAPHRGTCLRRRSSASSRFRCSQSRSVHSGGIGGGAGCLRGCGMVKWVGVKP